MPELPEVETIKLQLKKYLVGHKIEGVEIRNLRYAIPEAGDLVGAKVKDVRRFAKVLSIDLSNGLSIVIHIKLTGQLIYRGPQLLKAESLSPKVVGGIPGKHTHVIFKLDNPPSRKASEGQGAALYYNDVRRFGWIKIVKSNNLQVTGFIGKLGPEPLVTKSSSGQAPLTSDYFRQVLSKTSRPIKVVLMDQAKIGGVGNIYANDALWLAKINPNKESKKLGNEEMKNLYDAIHEVLKAGLKYGGASELAFVTPDGKEGEYQNHTLAYGHEGEVCRRCKKEKIKKYFLSGRGTYVCDYCQR